MVSKSSTSWLIATFITAWSRTIRNCAAARTPSTAHLVTRPAYALGAGDRVWIDGLDRSPPPAPASSSSAPPQAKLVLTALIAVAAVANLNLAVANVALPDIGKAFDASQTGLDLVAVGYSLGLAASVLYLGALGDAHGRKQMLLAGTALAIPASLAAGFAPSIEVLFFARLRRRPRRRDGLPDHAGADHRALERAGADQVDRALVGARGRDLGPRAAGLRRAAGAVRLGLGLLRHPAAGRRRPLPRLALRPGPRQRDLRPGRQPRRHPLGADGRRPGPGDQLRAGAGSGRGGRRAGDRRPRRDRRLRPPPAPRQARRSTTSRSPAGGSSGSPPAPGSSSSAR